MKNLVLLAMVVVPLSGVMATETTPSQDFETIKQAKQDVAQVLSVGPLGDFVQIVPANEELLAIYSRQKNSLFLSVENPKQYVQPDTCLINTIPVAAAQEMGPEYASCLRLFCGTAADIENAVASAAPYAVGLCEGTESGDVVYMDTPNTNN